LFGINIEDFLSRLQEITCISETEPVTAKLAHAAETNIPWIPEIQKMGKTLYKIR